MTDIGTDSRASFAESWRPAIDRPHVRPRVALRFPHSPPALNALLEARLAANPRLEGRIRRQALLVWMAPAHRRWWSPCLDLSAHPDGEGTRLVGYYTAQPQLMTLLIFGSILLTFLALFSGCWSMVQFQSGASPHCAIGTAAALAGIAGIYGVNVLGQRWAAAQMHELAILLHDLGAVEVDEANAFR